jgi:hypothetical protein
MPAPFKITTLTAYISVDKDGEEGVLGASLPGTDMFMPLIGADHARIVSYKPLAEQIAKASGMRVVLAQFSVRTDLEEIIP